MITGQESSIPRFGDKAQGKDRPTVHDPTARLPFRTLVYSPVLPPHDSGQAVVLQRIFGGFDPEDYCLVSFQNGPPEQEARYSHLPALPGCVYRLTGNWWGSRRTGYRLQVVRDIRRAMQESARRGKKLAELIRQEHCEILLAVSGMFPDLPAAVIAARLAKVPLIIQMLDHWQYKETLPSFRHLAHWIEPRALRSAAAVVAPNELLCEELQRLSNRTCYIVRNPIDEEALQAQTVGQVDWPATPDEIRIVYTGQIYEAHFDAMRNLLRALDEPDLAEVSLHVYSAQTRDEIARGGLNGKITMHPHVSPPAIFEIQQRADILFLPLAFDSPYPQIIRTSSTTKLGDYLASGRPMLVHAPVGSFPCWYAAGHGCGLVVDQPSSDLLASAIRQLRSSPELRERLGSKARSRAVQDFSIQVNRAALCRIFNTVMDS